MRLLLNLLIIAALLSAASCGGEKTPASPLETFKTYTKAIKQKDTTAMKLLLSSETIKMHEQEAKARGVTLDDVVVQETLFSADQTTVEFRNEKIEGDRATLEVKNSFGAWETVPFVNEEGEWKIDKKGYANQLQQQIDLENQRLNDAINGAGAPMP